jgi:hypothetical protein
MTTVNATHWPILTQESVSARPDFECFALRPIIGSPGVRPMQAQHLLYCTVTEMLTVLETPPPAAVTETEYVPAGVPGSVVPPPPPLLPPPPHPPSAIKATKSKAPTTSSRRFFTGKASKRSAPSKASPPAMGKSGRLRKAITVCGPVVETVNVVLPLVTIEEGLAEQVASLIVGGTRQLKATVPVNPPLGLTATDKVPDCPGAEMRTLAGFADKLKPGVSVTVIGVEAEVA